VKLLVVWYAILLMRVRLIYFRFLHLGLFLPDVTDEMTIAKEEIFGPVMSILKFKSDVEVIERANNTIYGLAAGICSSDTARAISMAHQLRAGTVWINTYDNLDAAAPFGGYKQSGHGRDKGEDALECWVQTKCVILPLNGPKT
jgi:acyl-CoA reductase-like NAD-dependent aldehyde dehydrogenase